MSRLSKYSALVAAAVAFIWIGPGAVPAHAATQSQSTKSTAKTKTEKTKTSTATTMSDSEFAKTAAEGGAAEVKLGQLAEQKGTDQQVKDFGQRMVTDHTKADDSLESAAAKDKVTAPIPAQLNAKDQATYDRLSKLSGAAFDRAYARDMARDHVTDVAAFRHEADSGKDASIKAFASQTLPTLEDHLKQAREMMHSVSKTASAKTTGAKKG
jgi:putative membrane protein